MKACARILLQSAGSRAALQLGHIWEVGVLLARQELLQMDLEHTYVTNLPKYPPTDFKALQRKAAARHIQSSALSSKK